MSAAGPLPIVETLYGVLLVVALVLNGIAIATVTPLRVLAAPLREHGLVLRVLLLDVVLVPIVALGLTVLLDVDPVMRTALIIVSAASTGPIGIALARIARGDVPLGVTMVVGLGAFNIITVPIVTTLLLPTDVALPLGGLLASLLGLSVAPLVVGRLLDRVLVIRRVTAAARARLVAAARRSSDVVLAGAILLALLIDPVAVLDALRGPLSVAAVVMMLVVLAGARLVSSDPVRVRTLAVVLNARAVGLALTLATLHLGAVEGLRAMILAYGGLTQVVPLAVVLAARRFGRRGAHVTPVR